jgi:hypothetical protein
MHAVPDRFPFYDPDPSAVSVRDLDEDGQAMRLPGPQEAQAEIETPHQPVCPRLARLLDAAGFVHEVCEVYRVHGLGCPVCGIKANQKRAA